MINVFQEIILDYTSKMSEKTYSLSNSIIIIKNYIKIKIFILNIFQIFDSIIFLSTLQTKLFQKFKR